MFKNKIGTNYSYFYSLLKDSTGSFLLANFAGIKPAIIVNITLIMISIIAPFSGNRVILLTPVNFFIIMFIGIFNNTVISIPNTPEVKPIIKVSALNTLETSF